MVASFVRSFVWFTFVARGRICLALDCNSPEDNQSTVILSRGKNTTPSSTQQKQHWIHPGHTHLPVYYRITSFVFLPLFSCVILWISSPKLYLLHPVIPMCLLTAKRYVLCAKSQSTITGMQMTFTHITIQDELHFKS